MTTPTTSSGSSSSRWQECWTDVHNEDWLAARQLLEPSPEVQEFYACNLAEELVPTDDDDGHERHPSRRELRPDWVAAASRIDKDGFSFTERRLAHLVAALTADQPADLTSPTLMGSRSTPVCRILLDWGTDGRATLAERS
jgi:hypothetical protein